MELLLLQDVDRVGKRGQKVNVKDGFGRNFLIPRGLAISAKAGAGSQVRHQMAARMRAAQMQKEKAQELAARLEQTVCAVSVEVGAQGKTHGAVTASDIVRALAQQGIPLDKHQLDLERPLTSLGETRVTVRLHPEVAAFVRLSVVSR